MNEDWLGNDSDDYLNDSVAKLEAAEAVIASASQVNVADHDIRASLGRQLAIAKNLVLRAKRDIEAHRSRATREADHRRISDYLVEIDYGRDRPQLTEFVHLVIPLPLERERLTAVELTPSTAFFNRISRLVNETVNTNFKRYNQWLPVPTLDSFASQQLESNGYHFFTATHGAKLWGIKLFFSGAIAYHRPLSPDAGELPLELFKATLEATSMFAGRAAEEVGTMANRYAIGSVLSNAENVRLLKGGGNVCDAQAVKNEAALVVVPSHALVRSLKELVVQASVTADEVSRSLETHYAL
jgi:hypothetical protein